MGNRGKIVIMKKGIFLLVVLFIQTSCSLSEDCFKKSGNFVSKVFETEEFSNLYIGNGIAVNIKEGNEQEVVVVAGENLIDNIRVYVQDGVLFLEDKTDCNLNRDYGKTTVTITTPTLININSKTEQPIRSIGIVTFPTLRLISIDDGSTAGTGDFYFDVAVSQLVIASNNASAFYINGTCSELSLNFYAGNGKFKGEQLQAQTIQLFHRGSNDVELFPIQSIEGNLYGTGDAILKNNPPSINVQQHYTGRLILN